MNTRSGETFQPLTLSMLQSGTGFSRPYFYSPDPVQIDSSAIEVMTDLRYVPAATAHTAMSVASASQKMIARGVRLLLVVDEAADVIGLVTARDVDRPRADQALADGELQVADIMTREVEVLALEAVVHARVGDILQTLKHSGRQHALVVDREPFTDKPMIRGVFSASQIGRQLGVVSVTQSDLSQTFAQIDAALLNRAAANPKAS